MIANSKSKKRLKNLYILLFYNIRVLLSSAL
jgi:hypothetical protein